MHIEVQTGRGRMDIIITHNQQKYIIETKIWRGEHRYQAGKRQLTAYLRAEGVTEGYYVVFDHREESRTTGRDRDDRRFDNSELCDSCDAGTASRTSGFNTRI